MIVYNITFQVDYNESQTFVVFLHDIYIPAIDADNTLHNPRLCRILSHRDNETECFSLQFECKSTAELHHWYTNSGNKLHEELKKVFDDRVTSFPTMMEII